MTKRESLRKEKMENKKSERRISFPVNAHAFGKLIFIGLSIAAIAFYLPVTAFAVDKTWIGASGGVWQTGGNWSPSGAPGAADTATIDNNTTAVIDGGGGAKSINTLYVGRTSTTGINQISMSNNTLTVGLNMYLGFDANTDGRFTMGTSSTVNGQNLFVGQSGSGTFTHTAGTHNIPNLTIANNVGSTGTYNLNGGSLQANNISTGAGTGTLNHTAGTLFVGGNWNFATGTFNPTAGTTATFNKSSGTQTLNNGTSSFANLSHNAAGTLQIVGNPLNVTGTLTNSSGIFDANDLAVTVTNLTTVSGGTYQAKTGLQTFNGGLTVSGGTFTGSTGSIDLNGNFNLSSGGVFQAPTGTFTVSGNWQVSNLNYNSGAGTVTFDRNFGTQTLVHATNSSIARITHSGAGRLQLLNPLTVTVNFNNLNGIFDLSGNSWDMTGATFSNTGTIELRGIENIFGLTNNDTDSGTWRYVGQNIAQNLTIKDFGAGLDYFNLTINDTNTNKATFIVGSGTALDVAGALTVSSGTFNSNARPTTVAGLTTVNGGTYLASTNTQSLNGGLTISNGTFTGSTGAVNAGDVTLSGGTLTAPSGTFNVGGNWDRTGGTFTPGSNTVTFNKSSGTQTLNSGGSGGNFNHLTHNGAGTLQLITNDLIVSGTVTNSAGTLDANGLNITVGGNWANTATFTAGSGTVTFNAGSGTQDLNSGGSSFNNLTHSGAGTLRLITNDVTVAGNLTNSAGTLNANGRNITVGGDWSNSATFTPSTGIVTFNKASGTQTLNAGASSFGRITHSGAGTLQLLTNNLTVTNDFTNSAGIFDLNGRNWTMTGAAFSNDATVKLQGVETVTNLTQDINSGTWEYAGRNIAENITVKDFGGTDYYRLRINDTNATKATFINAGTLNIANDLVVDSGTLLQTANVTGTVSGNMEMGNGTFTLENGTLNVTGVISDTGTTGAINIDGGSLNVTGATIGVDNFNVGFGAGKTGAFTLGSGKTLTADHQVIGGSGDGTFTLNGGTNNVTGTSTLILGVDPGSLGTYNLISGILNSTGNIYVGEGGIGVFNHTGGTNNVDQDLIIAQLNGSFGDYFIAGNADLTVLGNFTAGLGSATFTVDPGFSGTINVGGSVDFGNMDFTQGPSTIVLNGTTTNTITSGPNTFHNLVLNGVGGEWSQLDDLNVGNQLTVINGALNVNGFSLTADTLNIGSSAALIGNGFVGGTILNDGQVTANGGILDLTGVDNISGSNPIDAGAGFYAQDGGEVLFSEVITSTGPLTTTFGDSSLELLDLVNAFSITANVTQTGTLFGSVLAFDYSGIPDLPDGVYFVGLWKLVASAGLVINSLAIDARFDSALYESLISEGTTLSLYELTESNTWSPLPGGSTNFEDKIVSGTVNGGFENNFFFAAVVGPPTNAPVAVPEIPAGAAVPLMIFMGAGLLWLRGRLQKN